LLFYDFVHSMDLHFSSHKMLPPSPFLSDLSVLPLGPVFLYGLLLECLFMYSMDGNTAHYGMLSMYLQLMLMKFIGALEKVWHRIRFQFIVSRIQSHAFLTTESLCCNITFYPPPSVVCILMTPLMAQIRLV